METLYYWLYEIQKLSNLTQNQLDGIQAAYDFIYDTKEKMSTYSQDPVEGARLGRYRRNAFIYTEAFYNWVQAAQ